MKQSINLNRRTIFLLHTGAWIFIFLLPYIFSSEHAKEKDADDIAFQKLDTVTNFLWMGLFYLNILVLVPRFLYQKKYLLYIGTLLVSFCVIMLLHGALFRPFVPDRNFKFLVSAIHNLIPFFFTVLVSVVYKMIADKIKTDLETAKLKSENLKTELSFLRSQINPHFLFNVLNSIAALVRLKSNELEPTVMKLSSLMHYMLYETDDEKVVLKSEVEYLQAYIDLQKQRYSDELSFNVSLNIKEDWHTVEPMLLIPFVENAFKHGGVLPKPIIEITLAADKGVLNFTVKNKYDNAEVLKDKSSGIGLMNVQRRVELLYPGKHQLLINKRDGWFEISLQLILK